jgi:hypothetical protein
MPRKCETPLLGSGASRNSCGGWFQGADTLSDYQRQMLPAVYRLYQDELTDIEENNSVRRAN